MDCHICNKHIKRRFSRHIGNHIKHCTPHFKPFPDVKNYLRHIFRDAAIVIMSYLGEGDLYIYEQCFKCSGRYCNILRYPLVHMKQYSQTPHSWYSHIQLRLYPGSTVFFKPYSFDKDVDPNRIKDVKNRAKKHELMVSACVREYQRPNDMEYALYSITEEQQYDPDMATFILFAIFFFTAILIKG